MEFEYNKENEGKIIARLQELGAVANCPRCGNDQFQLNGGFSIVPVQENISQMRIGGRGTPVLTVICKKCGFLSQHALGILGLVDLAKQEETKNIDSKVENLKKSAESKVENLKKS